MRYVVLCLSLWSALVSPTQWSSQTDKVLYLFAPGFRQSERHATYYAHWYRASTGETFICKSTLHVIPETCGSFNFPEIRLMDTKAFYRPADLFSRLFSYIQQTALRIFDKIRGTRVIGESANGLSVQKYWVEASKVSLGQKEDIACLSESYDTAIKAKDSSDLMVLYGVSRGAATTFSFLGSTYLDKPHKRVGAVVLEGCYDSFEHIFSCYGRLKQFWYYKLAHSFIYDKDTKPIEPIDFVSTFPKNVPVLFVASQKDTIVSYECIHTLAHLLKKAGHEHVYLLELFNSSHIGYFCDDIIDVERYRSVVHAFYAEYDLPHIPIHACKGTALFKQCKL